MVEGRRHWLLDVAAEIGDAPGGPPDLGASDPVEEIWAEAQRFAGIDAWELARAGAEEIGIEVADLDRVAPSALRLVPEKLARAACVFPLREDDRHLVVASPDPRDLETEEDLRFASGRSPVFQLAPPEEIDRAIEANYRPDSVVESLLDRIGSDDDTVHVVDTEAPDVQEADASTEPVVRLGNMILREAIRKRASDVHLAPGRGSGTVRMRVDGVLRMHMRLPMPVFYRVVSRLKVLADIDISDRLRPHDGRARIRVDENYHDLRISTVPTRSAEKAVIRVLYSDEAPELDELGMSEHDLGRFRRMLDHRDSIILVTGPTGSGKTTTLYAALRELDTGDINIMTVEDPIEYELEGITQMQVERKRDVTFASALRAILRQDPDIILIGEIRDLETAEIAVQAAQTGHLVLATLHTNDAIGVVPRLVDLGLSRRSVADSLCGAVAQRLVRQACSDCAEPIGDSDLTDEEKVLADKYGVRPAVRASGCSRCEQLGYRGRTPVVETIVPNAELQALIDAGASRQELRTAATGGGMRPLRDAAVELVREGVTTLQEIDRALGETTDERTAAGGSRPDTETVEDADDTVVAPPDHVSSSEGETPRAPSAADRTGTSSGDDGDGAVTGVSDPADDAEGDERATASTGGGHVLLVDDDPVVRKLAGSVLEKQGFEFTSVDDGVEALELLNRDHEIDLMVLDLDMPKLNGADVLRLARSSPRTAGLPIVVLTGSDSQATEVELMEAGADDYIRKPLEPSRFVARIGAVLRRARG